MQSIVLVLALLCVTAQLAVVSAASLQFLSVGDWGCGVNDKDYQSQLKVAKVMSSVAQTVNASFVVALGDNFYSYGVTSVDDTQFQTTWSDVYIQGNPSLQVPWYAILGNHDWRGNVQAQIDFSKTNPFWKMPAHYFTQTWNLPNHKTLEIVFIDTVPIDENGDADQLTWINSTLSASTADFLWVAGHYPVYSGGEHGNTQSLIDNLKPMLEAAGAQYLNGHDHTMQLLSENGINYFVSGNGCRSDGKIKNIAQTVWNNLDNGFTLHSIDDQATSITTSWIDETGTTLKKFSVGPRSAQQLEQARRRAASRKL